MTYEDAKKRTSRIREAVLEERMPPWHADPRHGKFANDRRLTQEERDTLLAWIDKGAVKGDDKDLPPPLKFITGWKIGEPDKVFTMAEEFKVPATGVLDYQRFVVDPGFKEDVWVQAAECRPGNRKVVHHILVYILAPGRRDPYDPDGTAATLVGWAPGDMPAMYSPDTARLDSRRLEAALRGPLHAQRDRADRPLLGGDPARQKAARELRRDEHPGEHDFQNSAGRSEPQGADDVHVPRGRPGAVVHAAHAPARDQRPIRDDLPGRHDRDLAVGARLRLRLAERLPFRASRCTSPKGAS